MNRINAKKRKNNAENKFILRNTRRAKQRLVNSIYIWTMTVADGDVVARTWRVRVHVISFRFISFGFISFHSTFTIVLFALEGNSAPCYANSMHVCAIFLFLMHMCVYLLYQLSQRCISLLLFYVFAKCLHLLFTL